ncbi:MAG: AmmeMemoRadiSam system radical SAM enzyme [Candidatus Aureabacteria bacterium]|nr:AmmeMemoRadiSam system radical SAM enzyme [Candidatus Auribacterota bacterium]
MKEALLWKKADKDAVDCFLCEFRCRIADGKRGLCCVRENRGGTLYTLVYEKAISTAVDPIEKKPFFHFLPGSTSLSVATVGCNFRCLHCQNYTIAHLPRDHAGLIEGEDLPCGQLVALAREHRCPSISYTYTEPTVFFEYARDTAVLAKRTGIRNNFVTNGYMTVEALEAMRPWLDAANVDLKGFDEERHRKRTGGGLEPVKRNIKLMREMGIWVEVTTLVIPTENDSSEELRAIAEHLVSVDPGVPWHVSAFHPAYRMTNLPPTPRATIERAVKIGRAAGLRYVYGGNIPGAESEHTRCHQCGAMLITRCGFQVRENILRNGKCPSCAAVIDGVFE